MSREAFFRRPDLQFCGRTVLGDFPARGQEMSDHYMGPLSDATPVLACMKAIQEACFKLGIPLKTRHRVRAWWWWWGSLTFVLSAPFLTHPTPFWMSSGGCAQPV